MTFMLESLTKDDRRVPLLRKQGGQKLDSFNLAEHSKNTVVRITTTNGNCYFFQVEDPKKSFIKMFRCEDRIGAAGGYREIVTLLSPFAIGKEIRYRRGSERKIALPHPIAEIATLDTTALDS